MRFVEAVFVLAGVARFSSSPALRIAPTTKPGDIVTNKDTKRNIFMTVTFIISLLFLHYMMRSLTEDFG